MAVELGPLGRQDEEVEAAALAGLFELGSELRSAVDLDASDRKPKPKMSLEERVAARVYQMLVDTNVVIPVEMPPKRNGTTVRLGEVQ